MKFDIVMKDEVYDEIHTLMRNINSLNAGLEIGGWLTGDWDFNEEGGVLTLDKFLIPKQEVSKTEIDISPESMIDTIKELGQEQSNRIKAHWHIHPFGCGKTDWSSIDEDKISDFMEPTKDREIFVFLLSSEDLIKARVELVIEGKIKVMEKSFYFSETYDNLPVTKESELVESPYLETLKERIKDKVSKITYTPKSNVYLTNYKGNKKKTKSDSLYKIYKTKIGLSILLDEEFNSYLLTSPYASKELLSFDTMDTFTNGKVSWNYTFSGAKECQEVTYLLSEELVDLEKDYQDEQKVIMDGYENEIL